jgi:hypothetical protein
MNKAVESPVGWIPKFPAELLLSVMDDLSKDILFTKLTAISKNRFTHCIEGYEVHPI